MQITELNMMLQCKAFIQNQKLQMYIPLFE
jgi:hypothetical protein